VSCRLQQVLEAHRARAAGATVVLTQVPDAARFGAVDWHERSGLIRAFGEKARGGAGLINAGVYVFQREVVENIPDGVVSIEHQVLPTLAGKRAFGVVTKGLFVDIGLPETYQRLASAPEALVSAIRGPEA
jgi:NDP-sugar pyrophosphorylase family protein